jgi:hypothetical protein
LNVPARITDSESRYFAKLQGRYLPAYNMVDNALKNSTLINKSINRSAKSIKKVDYETS